MQPMSDRRVVVLLVGLLGALLGLGLTGIALLELRDPVLHGGETGAAYDGTAELVGVLVVGALLAVGGIGTAAALVRAQLPRTTGAARGLPRR